MSGYMALIEQSGRCKRINASTNGCDAPCARRAATQPLCDLSIQSPIVNSATPRNDDSIEGRRVVNVQLRLYYEAALHYTPRSANSECYYLITSGFAIVAGQNPCSGKGLRRTGQLVSGHSIKYNQSDCFRNHRSATTM
jgi:hypothetical protein